MYHEGMDKSFSDVYQLFHSSTRSVARDVGVGSRGDESEKTPSRTGSSSPMQQEQQSSSRDVRRRGVGGAEW
jgi:hypothetical protein